MTKSNRKSKKPEFQRSARTSRVSHKSRTKLLAAHHTFKLRPHHHTSYGSLALILLVVFLPLLSISRTAAADSGSQSYAVVPGAIPKTAPVITNIANGKEYTSPDPIAVDGTCPSNSLVKLFKNQVMGAATLCHNGSFSSSIDLFEGNNSLIARAYNTNDEQGPDSVPVSVKLILPGSNLNGSDTLNALGPPVGQFYLTSEIYYRGASTGDTLSWPLTIAGGQAPYAVSVGWGDGKTDLISRATPGQLQISHVYNKATADGSYTIIVKATDQSGNQSYLQLIAIVRGSQSAGILGSVGGGHNSPLALRVAWQLLAGSTIAVLSFWIGEKREIRVIRSKAKAV